MKFSIYTIAAVSLIGFAADQDAFAQKGGFTNNNGNRRTRSIRIGTIGSSQGGWKKTVNGNKPYGSEASMRGAGRPRNSGHHTPPPPLKPEDLVSYSLYQSTVKVKTVKENVISQNMNLPDLANHFEPNKFIPTFNLDKELEELKKQIPSEIAKEKITGTVSLTISAQADRDLSWFHPDKPINSVESAIANINYVAPSVKQKGSPSKVIGDANNLLLAKARAWGACMVFQEDFKHYYPNVTVSCSVKEATVGADRFVKLAAGISIKYDDPKPVDTDVQVWKLTWENLQFTDPDLDGSKAVYIDKNVFAAFTKQVASVYKGGVKYKAAQNAKPLAQKIEAAKKSGVTIVREDQSLLVSVPQSGI